MSDSRHYFDAATPSNALGRREDRVPEGDDRVRSVCIDCGHIEYRNPRIIVGAVCTWEDKYLLCRRGIEPRKGFWTMPAGYMELGETPAAGAAREVAEEACAKVETGALIGLFPLAHIGQVHMIFRARMTDPGHAAGEESLETALVAWADLPWDDFAYPTIHWAFQAHKKFESRDDFAPMGIPEDFDMSAYLHIV